MRIPCQNEGKVFTLYQNVSDIIKLMHLKHENIVMKYIFLKQWTEIEINLEQKHGSGRSKMVTRANSRLVISYCLK
jgi:hypothetical protein